MKGVILAAGDGTRMSSVTYDAYPKELLPIGNVPTIRFPIEALKLANINEIIVVIAPHTKQGIIDGLQSGEKFGVNICYVVQEKPENGRKGMGPAILSSRKWIKEEDFVVACGDTILCDFSLRNPFNCLRPLLDVHSSNEAIATILVNVISSDPSRYGVVKFRYLKDLNGILLGELDDLLEKPSSKVHNFYKSNGVYFTISGYYAFNTRIFNYIEKTKPGAKNEVQITDSIKLALENGEKVYAVVHGKISNGNIIPSEYWDVGVPDDYKNSNLELFKMDIHKFLSLKE